MSRRRSLPWSVLILPLSACSPLASSPFEGKHQLELTLHEVQTNLDELRHDVSCFQTEIQILDARLRKSEHTQEGGTSLEQIARDLRSMEKKLTSIEKSRENSLQDLRDLTTHANETTLALTQLKKRLEELETDLLASHRTTDSSIPYTVKSGDSLEKIARAHKTTVDRIKKLNKMEQDMIVVGQRLKIPAE